MVRSAQGVSRIVREHVGERARLTLALAIASAIGRPLPAQLGGGDARAPASSSSSTSSRDPAGVNLGGRDGRPGRPLRLAPAAQAQVARGAGDRITRMSRPRPTCNERRQREPLRRDSCAVTPAVFSVLIALLAATPRAATMTRRPFPPGSTSSGGTDARRIRKTTPTGDDDATADADTTGDDDDTDSSTPGDARPGLARLRQVTETGTDLVSSGTTPSRCSTSPTTRTTTSGGGRTRTGRSRST